MADASSLTQLTSNVRLTHLAILDVKGADAEKFLQGQTSAQVNLADSQFAPLTCFCTPKGRMLANAQLVKLADEHFRLIMSASLVDMLAAHLTKFAAFYRAELVPQTSQILLGAGAGAQQLAERYQLKLPEQPHSQRSNTQASVLRMADSPHWLFCIEAPETLTFSEDETAQNAWQLADIRRGLAWLTDAQQDQFLPQMLNWEALGGISFKKGCYTGQEVVARAHFRGQVKKRLVRAEVQAASLPAAGDALIDANEKNVGEVVSSAFSGDQRVELLAVMNTKAIEGTPSISWQSHPITLCSLPYAIERLDPEQLAANLAN